MVEKSNTQNISFSNTTDNNNEKKAPIGLSRSSTGQSSGVETRSVRSVMLEKMKFVKRKNKDVTRVEGPPFHTMTLETVTQLMKSDLKDGITEEEAEERRKECGFNEMEGEGGVNPIQLLVKQFFNILVLILIVAMVSRKKQIPHFFIFKSDILINTFFLFSFNIKIKP